MIWFQQLKPRNEKGASVITDDSRAFKLYKDRSGQFSKVFTGVIITSLFIFFVILLPYVLALHEFYTITRELNTDRPIYSAYAQIDENLDQLRLELITMPDHIIEMAKSLDNINSSDMVSPPYCLWAHDNTEEEWKRCRLYYIIQDSKLRAEGNIENIIEAFGSLNKDKDYIDAYLRVIEGYYSNGYYYPEQKDFGVYPELDFLYNLNILDYKIQIDQLYTKYQGFSTQANVWNRSNAVDNEYDRLRNETLFFLVTHPGLFAFEFDDNNIRADPKILEIVTPIKEELTVLEKDLLDKNNTLGEIELRLDDFESPFGKLPLGFSEIIFIFPFGLAIGSLICFRMLYEAKKFRDEAFRYENPYKSSCSTCKDEYIKTAPLWYEPTKGWKKQIFQVSLLLMPGVIFGVSLILIFYGWFGIPSLSSEFSSDLQMTEFISISYLLLYIPSFVIMYYCYRLIFAKI